MSILVIAAIAFTIGFMRDGAHGATEASKEVVEAFDKIRSGVGGVAQDPSLFILPDYIRN